VIEKIHEIMSEKQFKETKHLLVDRKDMGSVVMDVIWWQGDFGIKHDKVGSMFMTHFETRKAHIALSVSVFYDLISHCLNGEAA
jgi:hypothetical protein